jgi:hypothetical protein
MPSDLRKIRFTEAGAYPGVISDSTRFDLRAWLALGRDYTASFAVQTKWMVQAANVERRPLSDETVDATSVELSAFANSMPGPIAATWISCSGR